MKKKIRNCLFFAAALVLAGLWTWRVVTLNAFYQNLDTRVKEVYDIGEIVPFGKDRIGGETLDGYSLRVDSFEIQDFHSYAAAVSPDADEDFYDGTAKVGLVTVTLFNDDNEEDIVWLTELYMYGVDAYIPLNWTLLKNANPVLEGQYLGIRLKKGTSIQLVIPFELRESLLSNTWNHLEDYKLYLHLTSSPTQKDIRVQ